MCETITKTNELPVSYFFADGSAMMDFEHDGRSQSYDIASATLTVTNDVRI